MEDYHSLHYHEWAAIVRADHHAWPHTLWAMSLDSAQAQVVNRRGRTKIASLYGSTARHEWHWKDIDWYRVFTVYLYRGGEGGIDLHFNSTHFEKNNGIYRRPKTKYIKLKFVSDHNVVCCPVSVDCQALADCNWA